MSKKIIKTERAPLPIGPYNQAVCVNNFIFTAGQIALDPATGAIIAGGVEEQTRCVLGYVRSIIEAAGSSMTKIVKATIFLKDMNDFPKVNKVYTEFFQAESAPARSTIEVARLPKDALVEIEVIAYI